MSPSFARKFIATPAITLVLALTTRAADTERVAVYSVADKDYAEHKFPKDGTVPESYIFYQGHYLDGAARDASIENLSFHDLVSTLAIDLAKQNYFPTREPTTADLFIIVHWGTTMPGEVDSMYRDILMERTNAFFEELAASDNPGLVVGMSEIQSLNRTFQMGMEQSIRQSAKILGYTEALNKERQRPSATGTTDREHQLREDLIQERYFVILTAWDNQALLKNKESRLLWSTRFSMRAVGKNFTEALPALSRVAGGYFGRQLDDLKTERTHLGKGDIEYGEFEILGTESPSPLSPAE